VTSAAPDGPDPKPPEGRDPKPPDPAVAKLLRWYPRAWRKRYGDEFLAMVEDSLDGRPPTIRLHLSVAWAGLRERGHQVRRAGQAAARRLTAGRARSHGWFMAGFVFALLPYLFRTSPPPARAGQVTAVLDVLAGLAALAGVTVLASGLAALPAFARFVQAGGWPKIRRRVAWAAGATAAAAAGLTGLILVTRSRTFAQQDPSWAYFSGLMVTALALAVAVRLWTSAGTATARRLDLAPRARAARKLLGAVAATAASCLTAFIVIWYAAIESSALYLFFGITMLALQGRPGFIRLRRAARSGRRLRAAPGRAR
jgi:hypothetical protein